MGIRGKSNIKIVHSVRGGSNIISVQPQSTPAAGADCHALEDFLESKVSLEAINSYVNWIGRDNRPDFFDNVAEDKLFGEEDLYLQETLDKMFEANKKALVNSTEHTEHRTELTRKIVIHGQTFELNFSVADFPSKFREMYNESPNVVFYWENHSADAKNGKYPMSMCVYFGSGKWSGVPSHQKDSEKGYCYRRYIVNPDMRGLSLALEEWLRKYPSEAFAKTK